MKYRAFLSLLLVLTLLVTGAFAAATRSMRSIDLPDGELSRLNALLDQQALEAWTAEHPGQAIDADLDGFGALIYELEQRDETLLVKADLYVVKGMKTSAQEAPDGGLRWLAQAEAEYVRVDSADVRLHALRFSAPYEAAGFYTFENEQAGYEVMLPDILMPSAPEPADWDEVGFASAVQGLSLRIRVGRGQTESPEEGQARLLHENPAFVFEEAVSFSPALVASAPGEFRIVVPGEDTVYELVMHYPPEREAEYSLYAEFLRNSFVISEIAVG